MGASVAEILLAQGAKAAEARRRLGDIQAGMFQNLGNVAANAVGQYAQHSAIQKQEDAAAAEVESERRRDAAMADLLSRPEIDPREILTIYGPERGSKIASGLQAFGMVASKKVDDPQKRAGELALGFKQFSPEMQAKLWPAVRTAAIQGGLGDESTIPAEPDDTFIDGVIAWSTGQAPRQPEGFTLSPGQQRFGPDGKPIAEVAAPPKDEKTYAVTVRGPGGRPVKRVFTESELQQGVEEYREPKGPGAAPSRFWVMRNGEPVRITEAEYQAGDKPASTREQGRPVTSGDAGRLAELTTSLDDVKVLRNTVIPRDAQGNITEFGATGTQAAIGAALPNWVTEITGAGSAAKQRQAVIDRVKQVIGKALEGGVLRKEDEIKYTKILPTISDTAAVVETKLKGLEDALTLRRQRQVESLEDAGYDTSGFAARIAPPKVGDVVTAKGQKVRITKINPDGTFEGVPVR